MTNMRQKRDKLINKIYTVTVQGVETTRTTVRLPGGTKKIFRLISMLSVGGSLHYFLLGFYEQHAFTHILMRSCMHSNFP